MPETGTNLIKRARNYLDETSGEHQWYNTNQSNSVGLLTFVGDEIRALERELRGLMMNYFATTTTLSTTSGTEAISFPSDFMDLVLLERVKDSAGSTLTVPVTMEPEPNLSLKNKETAQGTPTRYVIWGDTLIQAPIPNFTVSGFYKLWYIKRLTLPTALTDTSPLPDECDEIISIGVAIRALMQTQEPINELMDLRAGLLKTLKEDLYSRNIQEPKRKEWYRQQTQPQEQPAQQQR